MKYLCFIILASLLIAINVFPHGCSDSVASGQWYEHIKTKERIKILDIGLPEEILAKHREQLKTELGDSLFAVTVLDYDSTKYAKVKCFMYNKSEKGYWLFIKPIEILKEDYIKIK